MQTKFPPGAFESIISKRSLAHPPTHPPTHASSHPFTSRERAREPSAWFWKYRKYPICKVNKYTHPPRWVHFLSHRAPMAHSQVRLDARCRPPFVCFWEIFILPRAHTSRLVDQCAASRANTRKSIKTCTAQISHERSTPIFLLVGQKTTSPSRNIQLEIFLAQLFLLKPIFANLTLGSLLSGPCSPGKFDHIARMKAGGGSQK